MDLDNIKKSWQQTNIKPSIDDDKIQQMLNNKGKSAFDALLRYDKLFFKLLIPCALLGIAACFIMNPIAWIYYLILVVGSFFWQAYKIRFLKNIDLLEMGILEVAKVTTRYKKYIINEMVGGFIAIIPFFILYTYFSLPSLFPRLYANEPASLSCIVAIVGIIVTIALTLLVYKSFYLNNIKKIERSIKEIREFESENT